MVAGAAAGADDGELFCICRSGTSILMGGIAEADIDECKRQVTDPDKRSDSGGHTKDTGGHAYEEIKSPKFGMDVTVRN